VLYYPIGGEVINQRKVVYILLHLFYEILFDIVMLSLTSKPILLAAGFADALSKTKIDIVMTVPRIVLELSQSRPPGISRIQTPSTGGLWN
jgi:energy-coupling factor transporter transmembrane protein EcfT